MDGPVKTYLYLLKFEKSRLGDSSCEKGSFSLTQVHASSSTYRSCDTTDNRRSRTHVAQLHGERTTPLSIVRTIAELKSFPKIGHHAYSVLPRTRNYVHKYVTTFYRPRRPRDTGPRLMQNRGNIEDVKNGRDSRGQVPC